MNDTINQVGAGAPAPMNPQFTTVVIRDAKEPVRLGNLLLGGVISAAATGNLVEEQFQREADAPAAPTAGGTTSDKYRAELYDEVWQRARDMGYGNVTDALVELERMKVAAPAVQAEQEPVAHVTKGDCAFWVQWTEVGKPPRGIKIPLYLAPPAQPDASVLVEALEQFADDSNWCYDTCDISRDVAKRSLAAYRAALAGKGDD